MEEVKKLAREVQESLSTKDLSQGSREEYLKPAINNMLHMYLPDNITMKESEVLATVIYKMVCEPQEFIKLKTN